MSLGVYIFLGLLCWAIASVGVGFILGRWAATCEERDAVYRGRYGLGEGADITHMGSHTRVTRLNIQRAEPTDSWDDAR